MRIAHIGPPLARRGGPAGYLLQLRAAAERFGGAARHHLLFPSVEAPPAAAAPKMRERARTALRPIKRALVGAPVFHRPKEEDLRRSGGAVDALLVSSARSARADAAPSLAAALASDADVLVAHESPVAERLLEVRRPGQQVWLMMHAPMPLGLDLTWSWSVPEWDWRDILALPDVRRWIDWELGVCAAVDRLMTPCPEAAEELARADGRFRQLTFDFVLTGAEAAARRFPNESRETLRARWRLPSAEPVALFLSSPLPYRGLDVLIDAATALPSSVRGTVAIAGPARGSLPRHPRIRHLGMVREVSDLLAAVDLVVNLNRFSLFDLSTIEAAQAGRATLLHATGGNLTFQSLGIGAVMLADLNRDTVARGLERGFTMSDACRAELGAASRRCYDAHLTLAHLWRRHVELYDRAAAIKYGPALA